MSNSNYSIGLQCRKACLHCVRRHLHAHQETVNDWSWARDVNGRDRDETETPASRDREVDNFSRDETETRRWYVSRPSRGRDVETETTTLVASCHVFNTAQFCKL